MLPESAIQYLKTVETFKNIIGLDNVFVEFVPKKYLLKLVLSSVVTVEYNNLYYESPTYNIDDIKSTLDYPYKTYTPIDLRYNNSYGIFVPDPTLITKENSNIVLLGGNPYIYNFIDANSSFLNNPKCKVIYNNADNLLSNISNLLSYDNIEYVIGNIGSISYIVSKTKFISLHNRYGDKKEFSIENTIYPTTIINSENRLDKSYISERMLEYTRFMDKGNDLFKDISYGILDDNKERPNRFIYVDLNTRDRILVKFTVNADIYDKNRKEKYPLFESMEIYKEIIIDNIRLYVLR